QRAAVSSKHRTAAVLSCLECHTGSYREGPVMSPPQRASLHMCGPGSRTRLDYGMSGQLIWDSPARARVARSARLQKTRRTMAIPPFSELPLSPGAKEATSPPPIPVDGPTGVRDFTQGMSNRSEE